MSCAGLIAVNQSPTRPLPRKHRNLTKLRSELLQGCVNRSHCAKTVQLLFLLTGPQLVALPFHEFPGPLQVFHSQRSLPCFGSGFAKHHQSMCLAQTQM